MSMWTAASDELTNYLAQREVERQRDLVQSTLMDERKRRGRREDDAEDRQRTLFNQQQEDRNKQLADEAKAKELAKTVDNLTAQRQASLNAAGSTVDLPTGLEGGGTQTVANPMGAQATRNALAVALRVAGAGDVADKGITDDRGAATAMARQAAVQAYQANPTPQGAVNLKLNYNLDVPKPEKRNLTQVAPGSRLVDPETGQVVYTAPREPKAPSAPSEAAQILAETRRLALDERRGKIEDAATEKASKAEEARALTESTLTAVRDMMKHPGLSKAQGVISSRLTAPFSQDAADFKAEREGVVAALALPNLGALKGPMSDKDVAFIKSISTKLGDPNLSDEATRAELKRVETFLQSKLGGRRGGDDLGKDW